MNVSVAACLQETKAGVAWLPETSTAWPPPVILHRDERSEQTTLLAGCCARERLRL